MHVAPGTAAPTPVCAVRLSCSGTGPATPSSSWCSIVAAAQLFNLQVPRAAGLRAEAASQLKVTDVDKAVRGSIVDRNNDKLAFTIEARALTFQPVKIRKQLADARQKTPEAPDPERGCATSPPRWRRG